MRAHPRDSPLPNAEERERARARAFVIQRSANVDVSSSGREKRGGRYMGKERESDRCFLRICQNANVRVRRRARRRYSQFIFYFDNEMFYIFSIKFKLVRVEDAE